MKNMSDYVNTNPATTDTPNGTFKNETQPNAGDGTDIKAEHMQDLFYALFQVLQLAGEIPSGELENGKANKQFIRCLAHIGWFKYDSTITYKKNAIVINTVNNITKLYRSQIDNNTAPLTDNSNSSNNNSTNTNSWINILTVNADNTITLNSTSVDNNGVFIGAFMYGIRNDTPEGWLRCDGSEYSASIFSGFVNNHILTGKIPYKTLTEWQTEYNNNNGNCGYFGYDATSNILKTPCFQDRVFIAQALNSGNIGKFNLDQIVNIYGLVLTGEDISKANPSGAFYVSGTRSGGSVNESETSRDVTFDASRVVRTGDRVQPQHIQYPLFICVSNTPIPTTEAKYNEFINGLNNKVNLNGSNVINDIFKKGITNCILEAPNGIMAYTSNSITIKAGLKILIPNGRNLDGSLNNIEYTYTADYTNSNLGIGTSDYYIWAYNGQLLTLSIPSYIFYQEAQPVSVIAYVWYKPSENKTYVYDGTNWVRLYATLIGKFTAVSGSITSLTPFNILSLADSSGSNMILDKLSTSAKNNIDKCLIADLTTGVSVSSGYVCEYYCYLWNTGSHVGASGYVYINGVLIGNVNCQAWNTAGYARSNAYIYCKPGDVITYTNADVKIFKLN